MFIAVGKYRLPTAIFCTTLQFLYYENLLFFLCFDGASTVIPYSSEPHKTINEVSHTALYFPPKNNAVISSKISRYTPDDNTDTIIFCRFILLYEIIDPMNDEINSNIITA